MSVLREGWGLGAERGPDRKDASRTRNHQEAVRGSPCLPLRALPRGDVRASHTRPAGLGAKASSAEVPVSGTSARARPSVRQGAGRARRCGEELGLLSTSCLAAWSLWDPALLLLAGLLSVRDRGVGRK